jgi:hypothetical protein
LGLTLGIVDLCDMQIGSAQFCGYLTGFNPPLDTGFPAEGIPFVTRGWWGNPSPESCGGGDPDRV